MTKYLSAWIFLLPMAAIATVSSSSGTRNGGNMYVAAFYQFAEDLTATLSSVDTEQMIDIYWIQNRLPTLKVESIPGELILNGVAVDAVNYPHENRIQFSEERWQKMDSAQKAQLVIHELLGLSGNDDVQYKNSSALLQWVGSASPYDNSLFASAQPCDGTRSLRGVKAKTLARALGLAGVANLRLQALQCQRNLDDVTQSPTSEVQCSPVASQPAQAEVLTDALSFIGLWNGSSSSLQKYAVDEASCQLDPANSTYECQVKAKWAWGCPAAASQINSPPKAFGCSIYHSYREKIYGSQPGQKTLSAEKFVVEKLDDSITRDNGDQDLESSTQLDKDIPLFIEVYETSNSTKFDLRILPDDSESTEAIAGFPLILPGAAVDAGSAEALIEIGWKRIDEIMTSQAQATGVAASSLVYLQSKLVCRPLAAPSSPAIPTSR